MMAISGSGLQNRVEGSTKNLNHQWKNNLLLTQINQRRCEETNKRQRGRRMNERVDRQDVFIYHTEWMWMSNSTESEGEEWSDAVRWVYYSLKMWMFATKQLCQRLSCNYMFWPKQTAAFGQQPTTTVIGKTAKPGNPINRWCRRQLAHTTLRYSIRFRLFFE